MRKEIYWNHALFKQAFATASHLFKLLACIAENLRLTIIFQHITEILENKFLFISECPKCI